MIGIFYLLFPFKEKLFEQGGVAAELGGEKRGGDGKGVALHIHSGVGMQRLARGAAAFCGGGCLVRLFGCGLGALGSGEPIIRRAAGGGRLTCGAAASAFRLHIIARTVVILDSGFIFYFCSTGCQGGHRQD